jgi:hypothetical protein
LKTAIIFSDGFESGTLAAWSAIFGNVSVIADAHHGKYCMRANDNGEAYTRVTGLNNTIMNFRAYIKLMSFPNTANTPLLLGTANANWNGALQLLFSMGAWRIQAYGRDGGGYVTRWGLTDLELDRWYCMEMDTVIAAAGSLRVYLDDNLEAELTGIANNALGNITLVSMGLNSNFSSWEARFDCAVLDSVNHVGIEPSQVTVKEVCNAVANSIGYGARVRSIHRTTLSPVVIG